MSLLREIQDSAVDAREPIGTLLRKCKILAVRLGSYEFKLWVDNELNGYSDKTEVPEYRIMTVGCKGHFSGPFGSSMNNADIPSRCIKKKFRDGLFTSYVAQPISSIESLIEASDGDTVQEPWPADATAYFGMDIYQGMNCIQAWKVIPVNALVGVIDKIRNNILNFVLEIESEAPEAGEAPINSKPVDNEKVQQIFHTYITGDVQNLATGSNNVNQHASTTCNNEIFSELLDALMKTEDSSQSKEKITGTVESMRDTQGTQRYKTHYKNFMSFLSDHMQVYGPVVAPYLPTLAAIVP